ncbi:hypothetical protein AwWohl_14880 [Gammaproteobacteria bacterium]|nr:hypothetical protein AwWohl_14880 [Gammaproteobacteria bacterium]
MERPKLRDNKARKTYELYPLGAIPESIIQTIGKLMTYNFAIGKHDIDGEDWGDIFANAIDGVHLNSPIGLADVILDSMAWSVKSVKNGKPHSVKSVRVISGRCSPDYSYGINNPHDDIEKTGRAVLGIWNERINIAKDKFEPLRSTLLIRNPDTLEFTLFEHELQRFNTNDYVWSSNKNGNLEGRERNTNAHKFTWQPHGSQFTILYDIPLSAKRFKIKRPPILDFNETMSQIGFDDSWVTIL